MRARLLLLLVCLLLAIVAGSAHAQPKPGAPPFVVIVNPANPTESADRKFVADAFLKKVTRWPDGAVIRPVDLPADSPARARFSSDILSRSVPAVKSYWQQVIFSGRGVPPPELGKEEDVVRYVAQNPGGIGYVSGGTALSGVKPLRIE